MIRTELEILLERYVVRARPGDYLVVDCGDCFVQSALNDDIMTVEARGGLGPDLLGRIDSLFERYRLGGHGGGIDDGCVSLGFGAGNPAVAEAMTGALDLIASATGRPLRLADGDGAFMPKRTGFLGFGDYGPIVDPE